MRTLDLSSSDFLTVAQGASYSRSNFGGASVSFSLPVDRFTACPFTDGEIVKVVWRERTLLIGPVVNPTHDLSADAESWSIEIYDYWWKLENIVFLNLNGSIARSRGILATRNDDDEVQPVARLKDALGSILTHAINTAGIPISYDLRIDNAAEIIPFAYASESYASLIEKAVRWRPNMASWFEYGADDSITLVIADHAQLEPLTLDIGQVDMDSISLKPRPDLVPPAVGLIANAAVKGQNVRSALAYPLGANLHQPYVVTAEIDVPEGAEIEGEDENGNPVTGIAEGAGTARPRITIQGIPITPLTVDHLKRWMPDLEELSDLRILNNAQGNMAVTMTEAPRAINDAGGYYSPLPGEAQFLKYELVEGQISGKPDYLKWQRIILKINIAGKNPPKHLLSLFKYPLTNFNGEVSRTWRQGVLSLEMVTTNVRKRTILLDPQGSTVGGSPENADDPEAEEGEHTYDYDASRLYLGFMQSYYAATRQMPYDGSVHVLSEIDPVASCKLNITGGLTAWESMATIVQEVKLDLQTGYADLTLGSPVHISLQDAIDKSKQLAELNRKTTEAHALTSSGDGTGGGTDGDDENDKKKPQLPTQGPSLKILTDTEEKPILGSDWVPTSFQASPIFESDASKTIVGAKINGGTVRFGVSTSHVSAYESVIGDVYLVCKVNLKTKTITEAFLGSVSYGNTPSPAAWSSTPSESDEGVYTYLIATVSATEVKQHRIGDLDLPLEPVVLGGLDVSIDSPLKKRQNGVLYLDINQTAKSVIVENKELAIRLKVNDQGQLDLDVSIATLNTDIETA